MPSVSNNRKTWMLVEIENPHYDNIPEIRR